jgi:hypothetical protein
MSRYFFHVRNGDDVLIDTDGVVLNDLHAVIARSLATARKILSDEALAGSMPMNKRVEVEDEDGTLVHSLPFVNAVEFKFNARYKHGQRQSTIATLGYAFTGPATAVQ